MHSFVSTRVARSLASQFLALRKSRSLVAIASNGGSFTFYHTLCDGNGATSGTLDWTGSKNGSMTHNASLSFNAWQPIKQCGETSQRIKMRWYSSTPYILKAANTKNRRKGEAIYQEALEALHKVETLQEAREAKKSQEMHNAIQKAEAKQKEHSDNPKAQNLKGVTVVKTVVKQTRKEQKNAPSIQQEEEEWKGKALALLRKAGTEYGHPEALALLGNGELEKAKELWRDFESSSIAKQPPSSALDAVQLSVRKALDYYRMAGEKGTPAGWFNVGQLLWSGFPAAPEDQATEEQGYHVAFDDTEQQQSQSPLILSPDREAAMDAFYNAIDLGDPDAMYFVGVILLGSDEAGISNVDFLRKGYSYIQSSAAMGHGPARYYLALFHLYGKDELDMEACSPEEFANYLNAAVDTGDADALFFRGTLYHGYEEHVYGYPHDVKLAFKDFLASAEAGNAAGAVSAGAMLFAGQPGLPQDQKRAFELYQMAGEMGSPEGWRNVAACYAEGKGVPQSLPTAKYIIKTMLSPQEQ